MRKTSVLLICFNRPQHTRRVLEAILAAEPCDLYVFQDGPRSGNETDMNRCAEVREVIKELTSPIHGGIGDDTSSSLRGAEGWSGSLNTFYSEKNLGCGPGPATAISWFFSKVEQGIVMEDDCLPHPDFFGYCEELLEQYKDNKQVRFINSTLYHDRWKCGSSYGFSHYMVTGAWAGWRRTWEGFDLDLHCLDAKKFRKQVYELTGNRAEADWWYFKVLEIQQDSGKKSYWDYQMQIHLFKNSAITIHPRVNLISNIGFDAEGTHTLSNDGRGEKQVYPILPLQHPQSMEINLQLDSQCFAKAQSKGWWRDMKSRVYNTFFYSRGIGHMLLMIYKRLKHE